MSKSSIPAHDPNHNHQWAGRISSTNPHQYPSVAAQQYPPYIPTSPTTVTTTTGSGIAPTVFVQNPQPILDGMVANINGKMYRFSAGDNTWHELVDASGVDTKSAPVLPLELDASSMLNALRQYRDFLDDLDGLDQRYADAVSDTLFGLREAIEALESIDPT